MRAHLGSLILSFVCLGAGSVYAHEGHEGTAAEATSASASAPAAGSSETVCKNGPMVRRVKVGIEGQSSCKVSYLKETEEPGGAEKVLWNAQQEAGFCQAKAQGFVEKLKGMGWACE